MNLLTPTLRRQLPPLYTNENTPAGQVIAIVKFFTPDANWTWYACEFDGEDLFYGFVVGLEAEWGYFALSELETLRGPRNWFVERDLHFTLRPMAEAEPGHFRR